VLALVVAFALSPASSATAHADITESSPEQGAVLKEAPTQIVISFNEEVSPIKSSMKLSSGPSEYAFTLKNGDSTELVIVPNDPLTDGSWSVLWQVVSKDGHMVAGVLSFDVGTVTSSQTTAAGTVVKSPSVVVDRTLELFAWMAFCVSLAAFFSRRRPLLLSAVSVGVVASSLRIASMVETSGYDAWRLPEALAALLVVASALVLCVPLVKQRRVLPFAGLFLFASQGLSSGHHLLFSKNNLVQALITSAHVAHLVGASLWVASLAALLLDKSEISLVAARKRASIAVLCLVPSVLVLALSSLFVVTRVGRWEVTLLLKVLVTTIALILGATNHLRTKNTVTSTKSVRRFVVAELALLLIVGSLTASIASSSPSHEVRNGMGHSSEVSQTKNQRHTSKLVFDDGRGGSFEVSHSALPGQATLMLFLNDEQGVQLTSTSSVSQAEITFSNEDASVSGLSTPLTPMGNHVMGFIKIPFEGVWDVKIAVVIDEFSSITANTEIDMTTDNTKTGASK
jgi:methionine-rich copper-binding protein CopC